MVDRKEIETIFSQELKWIKDSELKKQVVNVWKEDLGEN